MLKLIVGLGNPGENYQITRHNVGFMLIDRFAKSMGLSFDDSHPQGVYHKSSDFILAKPATYMNNSGLFVQNLCHFFQIAPENVLVIHDDLDHHLGKVVMKVKGSAGGHNGVKSIIECLGTSNFNRLKVGIGRPTFDITNYVLGNFSKADLAMLLTLESQIFASIKTFILDGPLKAKANLESTNARVKPTSL